MCYKLLWQMKYRLLDRVKLDEQERAVLPTAEVYIKTIQVRQSPKNMLGADENPRGLPTMHRNVFITVAKA